MARPCRSGRAAGTTGHKHRLRRPDRRVLPPPGRCAERQCATAYPRRAARLIGDMRVPERIAAPDAMRDYRSHIDTIDTGQGAAGRTNESGDRSANAWRRRHADHTPRPGFNEILRKQLRPLPGVWSVSAVYLFDYYGDTRRVCAAAADGCG